MTRNTKLPSQRQLTLPMLEAIDDMGGAAAPSDVYREVADRLGLDTDARVLTAPRTACAGGFNLFHRAVRFARQKAVADGLIDGTRRNLWALTEKARSGLKNIRPGYVVVVFETARGVALWAECETAAGLFADSSVSLIVTSPPYPLERSKAYGNRTGRDYLDWLTDIASTWRDKLTPDGSLFLNLGNTWNRGEPTMSVYQERLLLRLIDDVGYHLAEKLYFHNPAKLPSPAEWVTITRVRVTDAVENVYWLAKSPNPKASNLNVLREYSASFRRTIVLGGERGAVRPSGHELKPGSFASDNSGSIPTNLLVAANTSSNDSYLKACRSRGLVVHPARFPTVIPEFAIRMCTDAGDTAPSFHVWDPFGGSGLTGAVAERLGRRWAMSEKSRAYLDGAAMRFEDCDGYRALPVDGLSHSS